VWSLSVVLWEALSGQRLWGGQSSLGELIVAICTEPIQRLEAVAPWVPRELSRVVHRGLEREPERRTPTVRALIEQLDAFAGGSDRIVMSQLAGLSEQQRGELTLRVSLSDSAARRIENLGKNLGSKPAVQEIGTTSTIGGSVHERAVRGPSATGSGKGAMVAVALLSAAVAGGSAFYLARGSNSTPSSLPSATAAVSARVQVVPPDAQVMARGSAVPVVNGEAILAGQPGETLSVTVQHGAQSKTFNVSLGSDGIATPGRLVVSP
jgi:serine/threonine-protein kinase